MFKLAQSPEFWMPVEFDWTSENGSRGKNKFEVRVKRFSDDALRELQERIRIEQMEDCVVARELCVGWRGVMDDEGGEAEFNEANFNRLLNLGIGSAIVVTYFAQYPRARQKN